MWYCTSANDVHTSYSVHGNQEHAIPMQVRPRARYTQYSRYIPYVDIYVLALLAYDKSVRRPHKKVVVYRLLTRLGDVIWHRYSRECRMILHSTASQRGKGRGRVGGTKKSAPPHACVGIAILARLHKRPAPRSSRIPAELSGGLSCGFGNIVFYRR